MSGRISGVQTRVRLKKISLLYTYTAVRITWTWSCQMDVVIVPKQLIYLEISRNYTSTLHWANLVWMNLKKHRNSKNWTCLRRSSVHSQSQTRWYCKYKAMKAVKETYPVSSTALFYRFYEGWKNRYRYPVDSAIQPSHNQPSLDQCWKHWDHK